VTDGLFDLQGKTAVVTGAGSGLGRAIAATLAGYGACVVCADRDGARVRETAEAIGATAEALTVDVSDAESVSEMTARLDGSRSTIDVLVNNAGIATAPARAHELPVEDWDRLMSVNLRGVFLCTRALVPLMLRRGCGSIVNIASVAGLVGFFPSFPALGSNYAASKAGVVGFTRQIAMEYARDGIRANAIAPGWHEGTRLGEERRRLAPPEAVAAFDRVVVGSIPLGRKGRPQELAALALYLASDASSYVTGQVFVHDGGWVAA
jgi:NAD(P)-dependent dehydrogenase (short-subunit alcohol dehydrogenase family)